mgnify:CR=1 FL=1
MSKTLYKVTTYAVATEEMAAEEQAKDIGSFHVSQVMTPETFKSTVKYGISLYKTGIEYLKVKSLLSAYLTVVHGMENISIEDIDGMITTIERLEELDDEEVEDFFEE